MEITIRKPRKIETNQERDLRIDTETKEALKRALSEQDRLDAMVRQSIRMHGP